MTIEEEEKLNQATLRFYVLRHYLCEGNLIKIGPELARKIGTLAGSIGVPKEKVERVIYPIARHVLSKLFPQLEHERDEHMSGIDVEMGDVSFKILQHAMIEGKLKLNDHTRAQIPLLAESIGRTPYEIAHLLTDAYKENSDTFVLKFCLDFQKKNMG